MLSRSSLHWPLNINQRHQDLMLHIFNLSRLIVTVILLCGAMAQPAHAKWVQEIIKLPVTVKDAWGKEISHEIVVTVFVEDTTPTPRPIMVINHGRAPESEKRASMGRATSITNARWFARMGFLVAVPTRIGYGVTGGADVEDSGICNRKNYPPGYAASGVQTLKVLEAMRQRPDTAKDRAVILGQSYGGTTAITVAAENPPGVQATINFAGGGGGNPETMPQNPCGTKLLERLFADYGKTARIPTLWIYTENDMYMGPKFPKEWFDAFQANGGIGEYKLYPPLGSNGHGLFTLAPDIWRPKVLEFLKANGYADLKPPPPAVTPPKPASEIAADVQQ